MDATFRAALEVGSQIVMPPNDWEEFLSAHLLSQVRFALSYVAFFECGLEEDEGEFRLELGGGCCCSDG